MDEQEWMTSPDLWAMLYALRSSGTASERKLRLFAVACCRRVSPPGERPGPDLLGLAERHADGAATDEEVGCVPGPDYASCDHGLNAARLAASSDIRGNVENACGSAALVLGVAAYVEKNEDDAEATHAMMAARAAEAAVQAELLRDVFGNPFRPITLDPTWLTPSVVSLAQAAYEQRDFPSGHLDPARLAVLADALEEAGCTDAEVLGHLRGPGLHVRGCHVLDALLGKE